MLIDLIEQNVLGIAGETRVAQDAERQVRGDRKGEGLAFDYSPRSASMRQYELRCKTSFERGVAFEQARTRQDKRSWKRGARRGGMDRGREEWRPTVTVTAATLRVPETLAELRAWRGARTKSGGGAVDRGRGEWRPTVVVTAGSETRAQISTYGHGDGGDPPGAPDRSRTSGVEGCTDQERRGERTEKGEETYGRGGGGVRDPAGLRPRSGDGRQLQVPGTRPT